MSAILEWDEFRQCLKDAGWSDEEIDREIEDIENDEESGE